MRRARLTLAVAAAALLTVACGGDDGDDSAAPSGEATQETTEPADDAPAGTVTVLAAASLTESFETLADQLGDEYPDLEIVYSFGPSSGLVEQLLSGAPADVLATADTNTMDDAVAGGVVDGEPRIFARNTLALAVPAGNPGNLTGLADLANEELRVAICEPQVPCGGAAQRLLDAAGVVAAPDTLTTDVKEAASLVALGEADAALIYLTDAAAEGDAVEVVPVPESDDVVNDYPVAVLTDAPNPEGAQAVVDAITGEPGQTILGEAGFLGP